MTRPNDDPSAPEGGISRRALLAGAAATAGAVTLGSRPYRLLAQADTTIVSVPPDPTAVPGVPTTALGARSPFVHAVRAPVGVQSGPSYSPLQDLSGTITPSDLFFERNHNGVAMVDPQKWKLMIHGMVSRPLVIDLEQLLRYPTVTRTYFVECSGNGRTAYRTPKPDMTPQQVDGLVSNAEWTGVPLATLFREVGVSPKATWFLAEGGDAARLSRSVPVQKGLDDALLVWGQNGEPLRPSNGYPVRLLLPGVEGNASIKWLRRIELMDQPNMSKDETSKYTDPVPGGKARQFSLLMDVKSVITSPAYPRQLSEKGWWPIRGLAWSGRGRITQVEVSVDGGASWQPARLEGNNLPLAPVRFEQMWKWTGQAAMLLSRATDDTGAVQPTRAEFQRVRGIGTDYHFSYIRGWSVARDGVVTYEAEA
jgi:sulfane dehydrogenase subunit SoxC